MKPDPKTTILMWHNKHWPVPSKNLHMYVIKQSAMSLTAGLHMSFKKWYTTYSYSFSLSFLPLLQARNLEMKERELATISSFYREQLEILEKKVKAMSLSHKHDCYCISILATLTLVYCLKQEAKTHLNGFSICPLVPLFFCFVSPLWRGSLMGLLERYKNLHFLDV